MASPPLWRRLPAGCTRWRQRRSLGASERCVAEPLPPITYSRRSAHPAPPPAGSRFPTGTGGLRVALPP
eukprot:3592857-Prymnesium_polylepis.1